MAEGAAMEERPGEPVGPPPGPPLDLPLDPSPEERLDEPWEDGERPFRVLHVSQPNAGGVAVYVAQAAGDQRRRGWKVAVACPPGGDLPERCSAAGVPWFPWPAERAPGPRTVLESRRLRRLVRSFAPDVVHLHSAKAGLAGRLGRRPRGVPTVFQPHGWSWLAATGRQRLVSRCWERLAARWTDALVCVGDGELREGVRAGVQGPYRLVRNGVDLRRFEPADADDRVTARARLRLPAGVPLAVCIGRATRQKGQDVLLAAWPQVVERCPPARLAIVGDGEDTAALKRRQAPGVLFVPAVDDPRTWLAAADVVVLPSRWEGLPLTALEALATGRPVVGTDIPGIAEVVRPGTGALVPAEDPAALAAEVAARLLRPALAEREGREAAAASADYDLERTLELLAEVTREAAGPADEPEAARTGARTVAGGRLGDGFAGRVGEGEASCVVAGAGAGAADGVASGAEDGADEGADGADEGADGVESGSGVSGAAGYFGVGDGAVTPPNSAR